MKIELNPNYAYDLSELTIDQLRYLYNFFDISRQCYKNSLFTYFEQFDYWCFIKKNQNTKPVINAKTLFENNTESESNFKTITDSIASLLEYKNKKYGNSALEPLNIFKGKCKVGDRLDDKLARVKNNDALQKNDVADLIGYLFLVCKENKWSNFDEFKD